MIREVGKGGRDHRECWRLLYMCWGGGVENGTVGWGGVGREKYSELLTQQLSNEMAIFDSFKVN